MGYLKVFDPKLFEENDPKSRKIIIEYFKKDNINLKDNIDKYGIDLITEDQSFGVEVEHRLAWKSKHFPFNTINLPERKKKLFNKNGTWYAILSKNFLGIGIVNGEVIREIIANQSPVESSNKYINQGECFYKISKKNFKWIFLNKEPIKQEKIEVKVIKFFRRKPLNKEIKTQPRKFIRRKPLIPEIKIRNFIKRKPLKLLYE